MSIDAAHSARASLDRPSAGRRVRRGDESATAVERQELVAFVDRARQSIERSSEYLDRLDAALGDGDHGENMLIGCIAVTAALESHPGRDLGELLREIGHTLVASVGGASGPLYGTAFIEAGLAVEGSTRLTIAGLADAFEAAARGLARRGRCSLGDKTIFDALEPAARSLRHSADAGESLRAGVVRAAWAARRGMLATTPLIARRGLALRLGERSRGHQDPGATSCYLLVRALDPRSGRRGFAAGHR